MAQTVSDEELQAKRDKAARLREQIAAATATVSTRQREQENAVEAARLDAELARLDLQLHQAKEAAKAGSVKDATSPLVASAKEQMRAAEEQLAAAKGEGKPGAPKDPAPDEKDGKTTRSSSSTSSSPTQAAESAASDKDKE